MSFYDKPTQQATGIIGIAVGIIYALMHCLHSLPFPYPMFNSGGGASTGQTVTRTTATRTTLAAV
jgi:hypothetical protein